MLGDVAGNLLSPLIFNSMSYYGTYSVYALCLAFAIIYLFFAKEPIKKVNEQFGSKILFLKRIFVDSVKDMFQTLVKKRHGYIRFLLFIQLFGYSLLWFNWEYQGLEYLYMIKTFQGIFHIFLGSKVFLGQSELF